MEKRTDFYDFIDKLQRQDKYIEYIEEENKRLKGAVEIADMCVNNTTNENNKLKEELDKFSEAYKRYRDYEKEELADSLYDMEEENKKLREFKAKQEEMMFLIGASIELAEPKTYRDAEKLQKGKEIYEKLYKEELYSLREENKKLKNIIGNIVYLYKEEPTELGEYVKSGFKGGMSN